MTTTAPTATPRRVAVVAGLAGAFGSLDTAVNVAFPDITDDLSLAVGDLQWVVICFVLTYGITLLVAGHLGDRFGHHRVLANGAVLSAVGLLGCAMAPGFGWLLGARVAQGAGTAMVMASAPALLTVGAGESRRRAVALFQTAAAAGLAVGPVIAAPLVDVGGWRVVFWFRVPLAVLLLGLAVAASARRPVSSTLAYRPVSVDLRVVATPGLGGALLAAVVANGAMFATWLLVPSLLVDELDTTTLAAGLVLAASPAMTAIGSALAGRTSAHWAHRLVGIGLALEAFGMVALAHVDLDWSPVAVASMMGLVGFGLGLFTVPNMAQVMGSLTDAQQGLAGGLSLVTRTVGIVVGVALASTMFDRVEASEGFIPAFSAVFVASSVVLAIGAAVTAFPRNRSTA